MGKQVGPKLAQRFAALDFRTGGNNAAIVCESADLDLTLRGVAFPRWAPPASAAPLYAVCFCTKVIYDKLLRAEASLRAVNRRSPRRGTLVGPLIDHAPSTECNRVSPKPAPPVRTITGGERVNVTGSRWRLSTFARP